MSDKKMRKCPESVMIAGHWLVILRHEIEAEEATDASFDRAIKAVEATDDDMRKLGVPKMAKAAGLLSLEQAKFLHGVQEFRSAYLYVMDAHYKLAKEMHFWGIATPTDDEICYHSKEIAAKWVAEGKSISNSMKALAIAANRR